MPTSDPAARRSFLQLAALGGAAALAACATDEDFDQGSEAATEIDSITAHVPRRHLGHLPTPIQELPRLSAHLGGPRLLVKRDDLTGLGMGGNKIRKLEFLLADAERQGADTLITSGSLQSNHARQTAAVAARSGLDCVLALKGSPPTGGLQGNTLLDVLFGAELRFGTSSWAVADELQAEGRRPYVIPGGGSNAVGATAYVAAMEELLAQLDERGDHVDRIVVATGSGGTQAGLGLGAAVTGFEGDVLGISVSRAADKTQLLCADIANATAAHLGLDVHMTAHEFSVSSDFVGGGYGVMGDIEREAIFLAAGLEGLVVDPVYTGRALGGLVQLIRAGAFASDETVLFWHTGGAPAVFAEPYASSLS